MHNKRFLSVFSASLLAFTPHAFAYIDPGTGFAFASGIGAVIMGILGVALGTLALTFKKWMRGIRNLFSALKGKPQPPTPS